MPKDLGQRELEVLRSIVEDYVASGEPVGSAQIARRDLEVSSATIRNVMADLEALGYLEKPHPSAGRVPTDKAYRHFVDACIRLRDPTPRQRDLIGKALPAGKQPDELLEEASKVLNTLSHYAGVVATPSPAQIPLARVDFIALREGRVLAILVTATGTVVNKVITADFPVTQDELGRAANYLNGILAQLPFDAVPARIREEMALERTEYDEIAKRALSLGDKAFEGAAQTGRVLIQGEASFLDAPEFADVARLKALLRSLDEKAKLLELLDHVREAGSVQIFIGAETQFSAPASLSVIAAPYAAGNKVVGTLGVIGPTRMHYDKAIALVDYTARLVSRLIDST